MSPFAAEAPLPPAGAEQAAPLGGRSKEAIELERQLDEAQREIAALREQLAAAPPASLQELEEARRQARENLDRWQRAEAELRNYRRRVQFEREELIKYSGYALTAELLPVLDSFERALASIPGELRYFTWIGGIALIERQLRYLLERQGLQEIRAEGEQFDPTIHEVVLREDEGAEAGAAEQVVVAVLQKGYKFHDRLLRPALVKVGRARPAAPAAGETTSA